MTPAKPPCVGSAEDFEALCEAFSQLRVPWVFIGGRGRAWGARNQMTGVRASHKRSSVQPVLGADVERKPPLSVVAMVLPFQKPMFDVKILNY